MSSFVVVYDLKRPGQNYPELIKHLESYSYYWHFQLSGWIVGPADSAFDVAEAARVHLDKNDLIFVQELTQESAWWGYTPEGDSWIQSAIE